ncbi:lipid-A-disaccharide synthase [Cardinium endosymbiont of Tipula unca]|uniref:lipid-A-disaccharide synthase n=1 Tax=Cardinium endosymbiont of Tipula unca TaxID=3066216 RepID=UPI0030D3B3C6
MRYYIIAGEHSGDMHGADLIAEIKKIDHHAHFWSCGGQLMQKVMGKPCAIDCTKMSYMGLDFFKKFYKLWSMLKFCETSLIEYNPHAVVLIDYSGFNMRIASFAKRNGFHVYYYIPPKIWAHGSKRITSIKRDVKKVFSILPFEVDYYHDHAYLDAYYVGNPLVKKAADHVINLLFRKENELDEWPIIALLPGSRIDEVKRMLPIMAAAADNFKSYQFVVAGLSHMPSALYRNLCPTSIKIVFDQTYDLLATAQVGIIASGTASLEAALFNLPQIVVYKTNPIAYFMYKCITTIKYISLVNLLVDKAAVPELIQYQLTLKKLNETLTMVLYETNKQQLKAYHHIKKILGNREAALQTAKIIIASTKRQLVSH